jgi:hypothetical protein
LLVDIAMFEFGYLAESRWLGSEIRSVDPHWLGWLVCIWCYPPFNSFSFLPFDVALFPIKVETSDTVRLFFNGIEVVLWSVFACASLALGFKASNLTARGIVQRGPLSLAAPSCLYSQAGCVVDSGCDFWRVYRGDLAGVYRDVWFARLDGGVAFIGG